MNLRLHLQKIRKKINSEEVIKHRKQRPQDVEATFGQIKSNHNCKRLRLKGLAKVKIEVKLACLAYNLRKKAYKYVPKTKKVKNKLQKQPKSKETSILMFAQQILPKIMLLQPKIKKRSKVTFETVS